MYTHQLVPAMISFNQNALRAILDIKSKRQLRQSGTPRASAVPPVVVDVDEDNEVVADAAREQEARDKTAKMAERAREAAAA